MKTCNRCKQEKDESEFYRNSKRIYPYCKSCAKEKYAKPHYEKNKQDYIERSKKRSKDRIQKFKKYKATLKCVICGESRPWCLDMHHVDPSTKQFIINKGVYDTAITDKALEEEIEKCVPMCRNCHADHHHKMGYVL